MKMRMHMLLEVVFDFIDFNINKQKFINSCINSKGLMVVYFNKKDNNGHALQSDCLMIQNQKTPSLDKKAEIDWEHYNYPPLLNIMHFVPSEIPQDRKLIVMGLFALHLASIGVCFLNFVDNCIEGGIGILYSILFMFIYVPIMLYLFYRGLTGVCKKQQNMKIFLIVQPIVIVLEIIISIVDFLGFNGFIRVSQMFNQGRGGAGVLGLIVSFIFLAMAALSGFILIKIFRERQSLKASLM